jgi:MSHA biogenesis protein MshM
MIRAFYGIDVNPFAMDKIDLLPHQQDVFDILQVHSCQGGLCLLMGEPGTGKTVIKSVINQKADKTATVINVLRTLHTYFNTIKILCQAFNIEHSGSYFKCEKRLIEQAYNLHSHGKNIILIIDDAHLMDMNTLRKLRLLFEEFPKNHNIILIGQVQLLHNLALIVNEDLKSRVTYSTILKKLNPDDMEHFIASQLDRAGLPHNTFTENALALLVRSSEGILRKAKNLSLACMVEAVRSRKRTIDIDNVNRVLIQPHWRIEKDLEYVQLTS